MTTFLDACAIIYRVEGTEPWDNRSQLELRRLQRLGAKRLAVSELSWMQCRFKPVRDNDRPVLALFERFFRTTELHIQAITLPVIDVATELRAAYGLKAGDAMQAACALACGSDVHFVTDDADFQKVPGLITVLLQ